MTDLDVSVKNVLFRLQFSDEEISVLLQQASPDLKEWIVEEAQNLVGDSAAETILAEMDYHQRGSQERDVLAELFAQVRSGSSRMTAQKQQALTTLVTKWEQYTD